MASTVATGNAGRRSPTMAGSAHCGLGPYWAAKLGKNELRAAQLSARGGVLRVRVEGARVHLGGQAVSVMRGQLLEPVLARPVLMAEAG